MRDGFDADFVAEWFEPLRKFVRMEPSFPRFAFGESLFRSLFVDHQQAPPGAYDPAQLGNPSLCHETVLQRLDGKSSVERCICQTSSQQRSLVFMNGCR